PSRPVEPPVLPAPDRDPDPTLGRDEVGIDLDPEPADFQDTDATVDERSFGGIVAEDGQRVEPQGEHHVPLLARLLVEAPATEEVGEGVEYDRVGVQRRPERLG